MCLLHVGLRPHIDIVRDQRQIIASDIGPGYGCPHVTNTTANLTLLRMTSCTIEMEEIWRKTCVNVGHQPSHVLSHRFLVSDIL
jgi:hypothetical protein